MSYQEGVTPVTFEEWYEKSVYGCIELGHRLGYITQPAIQWEEVIAAMRTAWHAGYEQRESEMQRLNDQRNTRTKEPHNG